MDGQHLFRYHVYRILYSPIWYDGEDRRICYSQFGHTEDIKSSVDCSLFDCLADAAASTWVWKIDYLTSITG